MPVASSRGGSLTRSARAITGSNTCMWAGPKLVVSDAVRGGRRLAPWDRLLRHKHAWGTTVTWRRRLAPLRDKHPSCRGIHSFSPMPLLYLRDCSLGGVSPPSHAEPASRRFERRALPVSARHRCHRAIDGLSTWPRALSNRHGTCSSTGGAVWAILPIFLSGVEPPTLSVSEVQSARFLCSLLAVSR